MVGWFVLGYAFYSCLFAMSGVLASRAEELQSTMTPVTVMAVGASVAASMAAGAPTGMVAQVATFLPFTAPMVLPVRSAAGAVSGPTIGLSVAIVLVSIVGVMALAARVYAGGALHVRGQLGLRKAITAGRRRASSQPS